jgi:hypothetical protein
LFAMAAIETDIIIQLTRVKTIRTFFMTPSPHLLEFTRIKFTY